MAAEFPRSFTGEVFTSDSPGYDAVRRPANSRYGDVRPRLVVRCRSVADVVVALEYARTTGDRIVPRGGAHCFAGRSSTDGIVLELSGLDDISVAPDQVATIGAGARLAQVYAALHTHGRTLPAGCGANVGITGLTLGGGIGLLGRQYGLTCDRLSGAQVVLADGTVVECDHNREPDLFWALRGAGGGQFGVVTALRFGTVPEPMATRIEARWTGTAFDELVSAWQAWAPDAPDQVTVNLTLIAEPGGAPVQAILFGASTLEDDQTQELLRDFTGQAVLRERLPYHRLKATFADLDASEAVTRIRSEFFSHALSDGTLAALLAQLADPGIESRRQLTLTAMGGAYNRIAEDATAFAHRGERFLLEHEGDATDPWVDSSWATAHADGSGRVYPNFPDPALGDGVAAYHAGNHPRLVAVKSAYDPDQFFHFPQGLRSTNEGKS